MLRGVRHKRRRRGWVLYEAAILGVRRFRKDPCIERLCDATVIEVEDANPQQSTRGRWIKRYSMDIHEARLIDRQP